MFKKNILGIMSLLVITMLVLVGCDHVDTVDDTQRKATEKTMQEATKELGDVNIKNFSELKTLKQVMEQADKSNLVMYAYLKKQGGDGKLMYMGEVIGYPIPYGTEFTNPEKLAYPNYYQSSVLPQADPNGLYKAQGVNATWIRPIDPKTKQALPGYYEPEVIVNPFKLPRSLVDPTTLPDNY